LKQPNWIKISFENRSKEHTGHSAPDQAWFEPKYFLAFTRPDFKLKILTQVSEAKKEEGPTLFGLMGRCFWDVGLTKWANIVDNGCPNNKHLTKENFDEWIRDYLEAVARLPNIGDQLIHWLHVAKKPMFMPMHEFMRHQVQLFSYLDSRFLHQTMELPMVQEKAKQIFFAQPKAHQYKFTETNKMVPMDPVWLVTFLE
jgi:hypothetical protein